MKKLRLELDELQVETFSPVGDEASLRGTVHANGCRDSNMPCTEHWSTCDPTLDDSPSCRHCVSDGGCLSEGGGCVPIYTYEESYCQCSAEYSCDCAFSEASNCHRCTGP